MQTCKMVDTNEVCKIDEEFSVKPREDGKSLPPNLAFDTEEWTLEKSLFKDMVVSVQLYQKCCS